MGIREKFEKIHEEIDEHERKKALAVSEFSSKIGSLGSELHKFPVEEIVELVDALSRPEVIPFREDGDRIVIIRPHGMKEFAFLVFSEKTTGTRTHISFRYQIGEKVRWTRDYSVCCACCGVESYGFKAPKDKEEEREWKIRKRKEFLQRLQAICLENGIRFLGVRRAEYWKGEIEGVEVFEAHEFENPMSRLYGTEVILEKMKDIDI